VSAYGGSLKNLKDLKDLQPPFDTVMGLQPTWGLVCVRARSSLDKLKCPIKDHPLDARREASALEGWILDILWCDPNDPKGSSALLRILSTEGRRVCLC